MYACIYINFKIDRSALWTHFIPTTRWQQANRSCPWRCFCIWPVLLPNLFAGSTLILHVQIQKWFRRFLCSIIGWFCTHAAFLMQVHCEGWPVLGTSELDHNSRKEAWENVASNSAWDDGEWQWCMQRYLFRVIPHDDLLRDMNVTRMEESCILHELCSWFSAAWKKQWFFFFKYQYVTLRGSSPHGLFFVQSVLVYLVCLHFSRDHLCNFPVHDCMCASCLCVSYSLCVWVCVYVCLSVLVG
jgi:hypothetical protein